MDIAKSNDISPAKMMINVTTDSDGAIRGEEDEDFRDEEEEEPVVKSNDQDGGQVPEVGTKTMVDELG